MPRSTPSPFTPSLSTDPPPLALGTPHPPDSCPALRTPRALRTPPQAPPHPCPPSLHQAWLGFYNSHLRKLGWTPSELVSKANDFSREVLGLATPPPLEAKTVGKMGLKGVPGLNVQKGPSGAPGGGGRDGGGGGGGGKGDSFASSDSGREAISCVAAASSGGAADATRRRCLSRVRVWVWVRV